jgi:hypothetical protein
MHTYIHTYMNEYMHTYMRAQVQFPGRGQVHGRRELHGVNRAAGCCRSVQVLGSRPTVYGHASACPSICWPLFFPICLSNHPSNSPSNYLPIHLSIYADLMTCCVYLGAATQSLLSAAGDTSLATLVCIPACFRLCVYILCLFRNMCHVCLTHL